MKRIWEFCIEMFAKIKRGKYEIFVQEGAEFERDENYH